MLIHAIGSKQGARWLPLALAIVLTFAPLAFGQDDGTKTDEKAAEQKEAPPEEVGPPQVISIDFGYPTFQVEGHWNHVSDPEQIGEVIDHAIDSQGKRTRTTIQQLDGWVGYDKSGYQGHGRYFDEAQGDSFFLIPGEDKEGTAQLRIEGLIPENKYELVFYGSNFLANQQARPRAAQFKVGELAATLNASNNIDGRAMLVDVPADKDGTITLDISIADKNEMALLGVLQILGKFKRSNRGSETVTDADASVPYLPFFLLAVCLIGAGTATYRFDLDDSTKLIGFGLLIALAGLGYGSLVSNRGGELSIGDFASKLMMIGGVLVIGGVLQRVAMAFGYTPAPDSFGSTAVAAIEDREHDGASTATPNAAGDAEQPKPGPNTPA